MPEFFFFALLLTTLPELRAEKIDNRNFAIDTYYPTPNEVQLAEQRARKYWAKHASRFGNNPFYLAVETSKIFPGEVQDLWLKLINSQTTGAYFANRRTFSILYLKGIMIFDTRTGHFVSNREFIAVETPPSEQPKSVLATSTPKESDSSSSAPATTGLKR